MKKDGLDGLKQKARDSMERFYDRDDCPYVSTEMYFTDIGETVFLTETEAEAKLKGVEEKESKDVSAWKNHIMNRYYFRAKRIDNGEWVEGYLSYPFCTKKGNESYYFYAKDSLGFFCRCVVDASTICQCTGLKDKNGKLIWENDVCDRKEQYPETVKYCNGDWTLDYSYARHKESGGCYCNLGFYAEERKCVEVIGNIFDNPELLEV